MSRWSLALPVMTVLFGGSVLTGCAPPKPEPAPGEAASSPLPVAPPPSRATGTVTPAKLDCDETRPNSDGTPKRAAAGPPGRPPETLVLAYRDFGPQASASKLLGPEWWSWEAGGSWEICDAFDIRVVVFRGLPEDVVKRRYPTATSKADLLKRGLADYRYVEYSSALGHLDHELTTIEGAPELARMSETRPLILMSTSDLEALPPQALAEDRLVGAADGPIFAA